MIICTMPHNEVRIWLCCDKEGNPYLMLDREIKHELKDFKQLRRYWIGALKSRRWDRIRLKPVEKLAIMRAIELLESKGK